MGIFDRFKTKTVADVVNTAKETVTEAINSGMNDKLKGLLYLLPVVATALIIFKEDSKKGKQHTQPTKTVTINNYYYYAKEEKNDVPDGD